MLTPDKIQTQNLILRPIRDNDIGFVYEGLSNPEVIRYYGISYRSLEETKEQMSWYRHLQEYDQGIWFAISDKRQTTFFGAIGFSNLNRKFRKAEVGFWLLPQYWKLGIMQEAAKAVVAFGFENMKLHRIEATVETPNLASQRLLKKLDFAYEGTMKECEIKDGKYIDLEMYAKLNQQDVLNAL